MVIDFIMGLSGEMDTLLRRTGMPVAVIVRVNTREYDSKLLQNINSNRRNIILILYLIKH